MTQPMEQPVEQMVWKCEQWFGGSMREQNVFLSEDQARDYARKLSGAHPGWSSRSSPCPSSTSGTKLWHLTLTRG